MKYPASARWFCLIAAVVMLTPLTIELALAQCTVDGDIDGNGIPLTVGDLVFLERWLNHQGPAPNPVCRADLNGDCRIDHQDADLYTCYFTFGLSCFRNPFPFETCADPDTIAGACCFGADSCGVYGQFVCDSLGGQYQGNGTTCMPVSPCFICGDANGDGLVSVGDVVWLMGCFFWPECGVELTGVDANCDGFNSIADCIYLLNYIFRDGAAPCANCR